jgi:hypothetical protein
VIVFILGAIVGGLTALGTLFYIASRIEPASEIDEADAIFERARRQMNRVSEQAVGFGLGQPSNGHEQR